MPGGRGDTEGRPHGTRSGLVSWTPTPTSQERLGGLSPLVFTSRPPWCTSPRHSRVGPGVRGSEGGDETIRKVGAHLSAWGARYGVGPLESVSSQVEDHRAASRDRLQAYHGPPRLKQSPPRRGKGRRGYGDCGWRGGRRTSHPRGPASRQTSDPLGRGLPPLRDPYSSLHFHGGTTTVTGGSRDTCREIRRGYSERRSSGTVDDDDRDESGPGEIRGSTMSSVTSRPATVVPTAGVTGCGHVVSTRHPRSSVSGSWRRRLTPASRPHPHSGTGR